MALEQLKQEFATLDSAARHLKAELEDKTRVIEETNLMASNTDSAKRAEGERDEIAHQFTQARCEWEKVTFPFFFLTSVIYALVFVLLRGYLVSVPLGPFAAKTV